MVIAQLIHKRCEKFIQEEVNWVFTAFLTKQIVISLYSPLKLGKIIQNSVWII